MESSQGRPGPEADLPAVGEQQAVIFGGGPGRTPSEPPSGLPASGQEEAENVEGASRHPGASPKTSSRGAVHRAEREARDDEPGLGGTRSGPGSRRGAPGPEPDPQGSSRLKDPEPPEDELASESGCRRGSPGGSGMEVEPQEEDEEAAAAAGRAGRSFCSRLQDSRSLDGLSGACGGTGSAGGAEPGAGGGRRATISSPLELEGTVSRHGDLTHFVANNLQLKIRLSGAPQPPPPAPARPCAAPAPTPAIPPIDPDVLRDLERLSRELGGRVASRACTPCWPAVRSWSGRCSQFRGWRAKSGISDAPWRCWRPCASDREGRTGLAKPGPSRILRTQGALVGTARRGEAYILEALPDAFSRPATTRWALFRCMWGSSEAFPGGRG
uniref:Uncharacterized protein n=1 Tax=Felis catus TaxID=9685 RepID=A0ABI8AJE4_FELCA